MADLPVHADGEPMPASPWSADPAFNRGVQAGLTYALGFLRCGRFTPEQTAGILAAAVEFTERILCPSEDSALREAMQIAQDNFAQDMLFWHTKDRQHWVRIDDLANELDDLLTEKEQPSNKGVAP